MTTIRFLAKSFISPWIILVAGVAAQVVNLSVGEQPWAGEYLLSAEWHLTSLYLWLPPVTAAVSFDFGRQFSNASVSLLSLASFRNPTALRLLVLDALLLAGLLIGGATVYVSYLQWWPPEGLLLFTLQVLLGGGVGVVLILLAAVLGVLAGWKIAPVISLVGALIILLRGMTSSASIFSIGGANGSLVGLTVPGAVQAAQMAGLLVLGGVAVWLIRQAPTRTMKTTGIVLSAAALTVGLAAPALGAPKYALLRQPVEQVCIGDGTGREAFACITTQHRRLFDPLVERFTTLHAVGEEYGLKGIPPTIIEYTFNQGVSEEGVLTWMPTKAELDLRNPHVSLEGFVQSISQPTWCSGLSGDAPPNDRYLKAITTVQESLTVLLSDEESSKTEKVSAAETFNEMWPEIVSCEGVQ